MKTRVLKLDPKNPDLTQVEEAAGVVDAGGLVAFPTETVYGLACRATHDSIARLDKTKQRALQKYYTLHIGRKRDVEKYVPSIGLRAKKLIKNAWPGPLTIVFDLNQKDIEKQCRSFEKGVYTSLYRDNSIGIRCPDNIVAQVLLRNAQMPVVAPSANITGKKPATNAGQVLEQFADKIDVLIDAGPCRYKKNSTVVNINKGNLRILRTGAYPPEDLENLSKVKFLFVCTGNTCRSPMAEVIFAKFWAEKIGSKVDQLENIGYKTMSAGTLGIDGLPASPEAVAVCAAKGLDLKAHKSTALSKQLIDESDFIFAMSRGHCERVVALVPEAAEKCLLLAENKEIPDPIGQSQQVYETCAETIEQAIMIRISEYVI